MHMIGFSNGTLYRVEDVASAATLGKFYSVAPDCVEIFAHSDPGRMGLSLAAAGVANKFARRSVHAPTHVRYGRTAESKALLKMVASLYAAIGAELVVIHPDVVDDWEVFNDFPMQIGVENMDSRKSSFRDVESMRSLFDQHENFKMVLDLNHCFTNDPTMKLAERFIETLGDKVGQIHLSGFAGFHEPLFQTKQLEILKYCRELNAPIVIESVLPDAADIKKEFDYIVENLK